MAMRSESLWDDFEIVLVVGDRAERSALVPNRPRAVAKPIAWLRKKLDNGAKHGQRVLPNLLAILSA